jgi:hypothetical protein
MLASVGVHVDGGARGRGGLRARPLRARLDGGQCIDGVRLADDGRELSSEVGMSTSAGSQRRALRGQGGRPRAGQRLDAAVRPERLAEVAEHRQAHDAGSIGRARQQPERRHDDERHEQEGEEEVVVQPRRRRCPADASPGLEDKPFQNSVDISLWMPMGGTRGGFSFQGSSWLNHDRIRTGTAA